MATTIKLKNGSGAPLAGDLVAGEPALDLTNKRLYTEDTGGTVIEVGTNPSTIDINAGTIDGTVIGGASAAAGTFTTFTSTGIDDNATSTAITIDASENVGIGAAIPSNRLHVNWGGGAQARFSNGASDYYEILNDTVNNILISTGPTLYRNTGADPHIFQYNNGSNEAMRIDSSGNVGIGGTPASAFDVFRSSGYPTIKINAAGGANGWVSLQHGVTTGTSWLYASGALNLGSGGTAERVTINSSGNVGINESSPNAKLNVVSDVTPGSVDTFGSAIISSTAGAFGPRVNIASSSTTGNGYIWSVDRGVSSSNLVLQQHGGNVGIGTSSPNAQLEISSAAGATLRLSDTSTSSSGGDDIGTLEFYSADFSSPGASVRAYVKAVTQDVYNQAALTFATGSNGNAAAERMRIDASGNLLVGTTATSPISSQVDGISLNKLEAAFYRATSGGTPVSIGRGGNGSVIDFYRTGPTKVGSVTVSSGATAYNTSSDYRLKENVVDLDNGIDRLKQIPVHRFNFIADPDKTVDGFIAHEVQDVVPEAITGAKDGMTTEEYEVSPAVLDEEGNVVTDAVMGTREVPEYQGIDQSKLVPLLTAALQEAVAKIEDLESRLSALEAT